MNSTESELFELLGRFISIFGRLESGIKQTVFSNSFLEPDSEKVGKDISFSEVINLFGKHITHYIKSNTEKDELKIMIKKLTELNSLRNSLIHAFATPAAINIVNDDKFKPEYEYGLKFIKQKMDLDLNHSLHDFSITKKELENYILGIIMLYNNIGRIINTVIYNKTIKRDYDKKANDCLGEPNYFPIFDTVEHQQISELDFVLKRTV